MVCASRLCGYPRRPARGLDATAIVDVFFTYFRVRKLGGIVLMSLLVDRAHDHRCLFIYYHGVADCGGDRVVLLFSRAPNFFG